RLERGSDPLVDPPVALVPARIDIGEVEPPVEGRPEDRVGKPCIIGMVLLAGEIDHADLHALDIAKARLFTGIIDEFAGPAEPEAFAFQQRLLEGNGQSTSS